MDTPLPRLSRWSAQDKEKIRFDNSKLGHARVGPRPPGRIQVDCHFLFQQSEWGTLTEARHPGGIVYIDLDFHQPLNCRLKNATVKLTLDDEDPSLPNFSHERKMLGVPYPSVNILSHGPKQFCGPHGRAYKITRKFATPRLEAGGFFAIGGLGRESERHTEEVSPQWGFTSHLTRSDHVKSKSSRRTSWASNQLIWTLTENELAVRPAHNSTIHTGFAFAHGGQPFFMKVEVSGRLESRLSNTYQKFRQAFGPSSRSDSFATTVIEFGDITRFTDSLDRKADNLDQSMMEKNESATLREFPNTRPVGSREEQVNGGPPALYPGPPLPIHSDENSSRDTSWDLADENDEPALTSDGLEQQKRIFDFLTQPPRSPPNYGVTLTTRAPSPSPGEDGDMLGPAKASARGASLVSEASDVTLVDEAPPSTVGPDAEDKRKAGGEADGADAEAVLRVLKLCGVFAVTQAILGLLAYFRAFAASRRNRPAIAAKKVSIDEEPKPEGRPAVREGRKRTRMPVDSAASG